MREILLKGKRKDNGEWIEGSLITSINRAWISSEKNRFAEIKKYF